MEEQKSENKTENLPNNKEDDKELKSIHYFGELPGELVHSAGLSSCEAFLTGAPKLFDKLCEKFPDVSKENLQRLIEAFYVNIDGELEGDLEKLNRFMEHYVFTLPENVPFPDQEVFDKFLEVADDLPPTSAANGDYYKACTDDVKRLMGKILDSKRKQKENEIRLKSAKQELARLQKLDKNMELFKTELEKKQPNFLKTHEENMD